MSDELIVGDMTEITPRKTLFGFCADFKMRYNACLRDRQLSLRQENKANMKVLTLRLAPNVSQSP